MNAIHWNVCPKENKLNCMAWIQITCSKLLSHMPPELVSYFVTCDFLESLNKLFEIVDPIVDCKEILSLAFASLIILWNSYTDEYISVLFIHKMMLKNIMSFDRLNNAVLEVLKLIINEKIKFLNVDI